MFCLQNFAFPSLSIKALEALYVRTSLGAVTSLSEGKIKFIPGGHATFDTYFNGLTVGTWKQKCAINNLYLRLRGEGAFLIKVGLHRWGFNQQWLAEYVVNFAAGEDYLTELQFWDEIKEGMLYVAATALSGGEISAASFETTMAPAQPVKLGIVITHFNRKQWVVPAISRIRDAMIGDANFRERVALIVVDNSSNITPVEAEGATLIPNRNLGGSGGFTRGLMHLEDDGSFTHCLFMDDDASCEIESIRRIYALLSFATGARFAVAGGLLREMESNRLLEKGARFTDLCKPLKAGLDMLLVQDLLLAEREEERPNYGAWWCFAFRLRDVEHYPFPFFVRGDDIVFGLMNKFSICTMNGIATWSDDFALKSGPMPLYLDARSSMMIQLLLRDATLRDLRRLSFSHYFYPQLYSYNFASAAAIALAVEHVAAGPEFWRDNIDMSAVRSRIAETSADEKMQPMDRADLNLTYFRPRRRNKFWLFVRKYSLNGFLLPTALIKDKTLYQNKSYVGNPLQIYKNKHVYYEYEPFGIGYVVTHDKARFFAELYNFIRVFWRFSRNFTQLRQRYQRALPELTSRKFWEKVYKD